MTSTSLLSSDFLPRGFQFAAVKAGIKASGNPDFACVVADRASNAAAMFTGNRVVAAPLIVDRRHLEQSGRRVRVVLINAGNANCATGEVGITTAEEVCTAAANAFDCPAYEVFPSSTGIIGVPLPGEKLIAALPAIEAALGATLDHFDHFARAIMTTDTRPKIASAIVSVGDQAIRIAGVCKGAGMIHPQLVPHATMLVYLFTDAAIEPATLDLMLRAAAEKSFNRISIDGDTSTNDTVLLLASGASGITIDAASSEDFQETLNSLCISLARQIVDDGEGVSHVIELLVEGAPNDGDALRVAKSIAHSPLVKTAWAGADPNWGRIIAAIGYSGVEIDPARIGLWYGEQEICVEGGRAALYDESLAHAYMKQRELIIRVTLGLGSGCCRFWTTDLTAEYVHINADYST